jgi:hypothetical protein
MSQSQNDPPSDTVMVGGDFTSLQARNHALIVAGMQSSIAVNDNSIAICHGDGKLLSAGFNSILIGGEGTTFKGSGGTIFLAVWDEVVTEVRRMAVAMVGRNGIEYDVEYIVVDGRFMQSWPRVKSASCSTPYSHSERSKRVKEILTQAGVSKIADLKASWRLHVRQQIRIAATGVRHPKSTCGIHNTMSDLFELAGVDVGQPGDIQEKQFWDWIKQVSPVR